MSEFTGINPSAGVNPSVKYRYFTLIPHRYEPRLLLLPAEKSASDGVKAVQLPQFARTRRRFWQEVDHINREVLTRLALEVTTLCCLQLEDNRSLNGEVALVYAMENHSPQWQPPRGAGWYTREDLDTLTFANPDERHYAQAWFAWRESEHAQRVEWYRPGWFWVARAWLLAYIMCIPDVTVEAFTQMRTWQRSSMFKAVPNYGDTIYFKAVPPVFAHEVPLTAWLSNQFPDYFPHVVALDTERHWLLLRDHGKRSLEAVQDIGMWETALRVLARLQIRLSETPDELRALGIPSQTLDETADYLDVLLADETALRAGGFLDDAAIARLRQQQPQLKAMCAELAACGIPYSLEHGDFYPGQVIVQGDRLVFIDWSDATLTHPFFSYVALEIFVENEMPQITPEMRARLQAAYLEPWAEFVDQDTLSRTLALARPLAALHTAVRYHRLILPSMESGWEMENMLPYWLSVLLDALPAPAVENSEQ